MTPPLRRSLRLNPAHPPLFPSPFFPILHLPPELMIHTASYLTPLDIYALLLTSHAFEHVVAVFTTRYTREQEVCGGEDVECFTPLEYFCSRGVERVVQRMLQNGVNPNKTVVTEGMPDTDILLREFDSVRRYLPSSQVEELDWTIRFLTAPQNPAHASGRMNSIRTLIQKFGLAPAQHISPLIHAIWHPCPKIVALLLQYGAEPNERESSKQFTFDDECIDNTPLHFAVGEPPADPPGQHYSQEENTDRSVKLEQIVQLLIDAGADVNARNEFSHSPLHLACATANPNPVFVRALLAAGADMNLKTHLQDLEDELVKPIHYAVNAGHADIVRVLLDAGAGIEFRTSTRLRPLDLAVLHRRSDIVQMLVEAGADLRDLVGGGVSLLDPFALIAETTTTDDLMAWFLARSVRVSSITLAEWSRIGMGTNPPPYNFGR